MERSGIPAVLGNAGMLGFHFTSLRSIPAYIAGLLRRLRLLAMTQEISHRLARTVTCTVSPGCLAILVRIAFRMPMM